MQRIDLTGVWQMHKLGDTAVIPAQVPGDTHSALIAAGKIPDPYWATNELDVQWVGREDWVYTREFHVDPSLLEEQSVFLNCDSLDTIAEIAINGHAVGATDNMFRRYRFEVADVLRPGHNEISILFRSAENTAIARGKELPYEIPHSRYPVQSPHINLLRKVACHGGWDWGCCLMVAGIGGGIYLGATSLGRIEHVYTTQVHEAGRCVLEVVVEIHSPSGGLTSLEVQLEGIEVSKRVELRPGLQKVALTLVVDNPKLWWPSGYGAQPLYEMVVRAAGDTVRKRIGLRRLEVVTEEDDKGLSFQIRVNGVSIFCRGANWIPADALPQRITRERLDDLLSSAVEANMNMIRVWGGGRYECDNFYELCDEKGLLVWQDFMFSCATYPATREFLASVREEVCYQVKRLRDHPCIALWCGNNECLGALNWYPVSRRNRDRYLVNYDRLFEGTIGAAVDEADPTRVYWPSSPSGGRGDYSDCWHDDSRGDMHYWAVWHENASFDAYYRVTPRFCSEFGYQSFPSLDTVKSYAPETHFNITAPVMEHHQRHASGNSKIAEMMTRYFRMPEGFAGFLYLSQVQQALAIKSAVEYWRHLQPTCMGALYWQLNDVWPVCSWSSLEYGGKWKLLHYAAKRFYQPVIVTAFQRNDELEVWVVNDRPLPRQGEVTLRIIDFRGQVRQKERLSFSVGPNVAALAGRFPVAGLAPHPDKVFAVLELEAGEDHHTNDHFFVPYKKCDLETPALTSDVAAAGDSYAVTLATDKPAFFVSANVAGIAGEFDDNCFVLLPDEPRRLVFHPKVETGIGAVRGALEVYHLRGTYR